MLASVGSARCRGLLWSYGLFLFGGPATDLLEERPGEGSDLDAGMVGEEAGKQKEPHERHATCVGRGQVWDAVFSIAAADDVAKDEHYNSNRCEKKEGDVHANHLLAPGYYKFCGLFESHSGRIRRRRGRLIKLCIDASPAHDVEQFCDVVSGCPE